MAVYVDGLCDYGWRYGKSCHLIADTRDELKAFAVSIGLQVRWYQPGSFPHFDLTAGKRTAAVLRGAIELDRRAYVYKMAELRGTDEYADVKGMKLADLERRAA
jgi:hypothetical protein